MQLNIRPNESTKKFLICYNFFLEILVSLTSPSNEHIRQKIESKRLIFLEILMPLNTS